MRFVEKLEKAMDKNDSLLCVGLDTDLSKIPEYLRDDENPLLSFNEEVVSHTKDLVCSYKINLAFYEAAGIAGVKALIDTVKIIPNDIPVIIDGKRGDIGNTARMYAKAIFEVIKGDATTLNPYLGYDSIKPFLEYGDRYVFVICKTSNP
ncbi:MAG: orotidine-5'-phosphate decarboxylase, partial [Thermoplasmata archaeon]